LEGKDSVLGSEKKVRKALKTARTDHLKGRKGVPKLQDLLVFMRFLPFFLQQLRQVSLRIWVSIYAGVRDRAGVRQFFLETILL
jgi:hypothetical protein